MKPILTLLFSLLPVCYGFTKDEAKLPRQSVEALVEASCIDCHESDTNKLRTGSGHGKLRIS